VKYLNDQFTELWIKVQHYIYTCFELYKLKSVEKISSLLSSFASIVILFFIAVNSILFVSIAFALWLGELYGKFYFGFLIVSCIHFLVFIIGYFNRRKLIKNPLRNRIIKKLLEE
jgi:hypothetical protein